MTNLTIKEKEIKDLKNIIATKEEELSILQFSIFGYKTALRDVESESEDCSQSLRAGHTYFLDGKILSNDVSIETTVYPLNQIIENKIIKSLEIYDTNYTVYRGGNGHLYLWDNDTMRMTRIKKCIKDKIKKKNIKLR